MPSPNILDWIKQSSDFNLMSLSEWKAKADELAFGEENTLKPEFRLLRRSSFERVSEAINRSHGQLRTLTMLDDDKAAEWLYRRAAKQLKKHSWTFAEYEQEFSKRSKTV